MPVAKAATKKMSPRIWGLLVLLSLLWGGSFFFAEVALAQIPPLVLVFARVAVGAVALLSVAVALGHGWAAWRPLLGSFLIMGLLNNLLPFGLIFWGQTQITSGLAAILNATTPLFTVVLAHCLTDDEKMTPRRLCGVLLGLAGVAVMMGQGMVSQGIIGSSVAADLSLHLVAQLAILGAAVSYAIAGIFGRRFAGTPPLVTASGQLTASSLMMLPVLIVWQPSGQLAMPGLWDWSTITWLAVLGLGLLSTALAYVIFFKILAAAGPTNLLLVTFLIPVSALLLGSGILGEPILASQIAGMVLIAGGLAAVDGCLPDLLARRPKSLYHFRNRKGPDSHV